MRGLSFLLLAVAALLFSGCSSKQYFEPEQTYSASQAMTAYGSSIVDLSRDGATLQNGQYIGKKGVQHINLGEGYRFLSESATYVLAGNSEGKLKIINKKSGKVIRTVDLEVPIVSASIHNGTVAYILNNNAFGIYRISGDKKVMENRSEVTYAIDTRAASPMFIDSLVIMPMLDGKLVIMDSQDPVDAKVIYLSSDKIFNNVIYLSRMGDTLIAATPKKLISVGVDGQMEYRANISDVAVSGNTIYLFTKEGEIIKLDRMLKDLGLKKFKYAHFAASTVVGGKIYALDQQGSLIVLSSDLKKYKIYDIGEVESPVFISGTKLYKDGKIINLSKLSY
jgi:outer membrane protein assembly factor BamB